MIFKVIFMKERGVFGANLIVSSGETLTNYGVLRMLHPFKVISLL